MDSDQDLRDIVQDSTRPVQDRIQAHNELQRREQGNRLPPLVVFIVAPILITLVICGLVVLLNVLFGG
jgi:hypothetical protein